MLPDTLLEVDQFLVASGSGLGDDHDPHLVPRSSEPLGEAGRPLMKVRRRFPGFEQEDDVPALSGIRPRREPDERRRPIVEGHGAHVGRAAKPLHEGDLERRSASASN